MRPDSLGSKWNVTTGGGRNIVHFLKNSDREKKNADLRGREAGRANGKLERRKVFVFLYFFLTELSMFEGKDWLRMRGYGSN